MPSKIDQSENESSFNLKRRNDARTRAMTPSTAPDARSASPTIVGGSPVMRTADDILALQRTVGNQAVARELSQQTSDTIQRKDDKKKGATGNLDGVIAQEHAKYVPNFATPLSTDAPTSYKVTVAVSQAVPEYLTFAKARMKSTVRNKIREAVRTVPGMSLGVRKPKTSAAIKEKAAVKAAGKAPGTPATDPAVKNIIENSDSVGHSWIKMSPVGASGPIQTYSFGFIPANGAAHGPQQAVPGFVRNPDLEFEAYEDHTSRFLDTTVSAKSYQAALSKIAALMGAPPAYMTIGYNCTQFTKDIAKAAGASFPSKAGMMIPISDRGFRKRALNPNALYSKLGNNLNTADSSTEQTRLQDPSGGFEETTAGIAPVTTSSFSFSRSRGMQLIDMSAPDGDPNATISVDASDVVIPTGMRQGNMWEVDFNGKSYYTTDKELKKHLEDQEPDARSIHTLRRTLMIEKTRGGTVSVKSGSKVMVTSVDYGELSIDSGRPDNHQGSCSLLDFWGAVGGLDLDS